MKWDVDLIIITGGSWRRDCGVGVRQKSYRPGDACIISNDAGCEGGWTRL